MTNPAHTPVAEAAESELATLRAEVARLTEEKAAAEFAVRNGESLSSDAIREIRELLKANDVPLAPFIDDHVRNAIVQRDEARSELARLKAQPGVVEAIRDCLTVFESTIEDGSETEDGDRQLLNRAWAEIAALAAPVSQPANPAEAKRDIPAAVAEMRQTARELRESANSDCNAARQAIYWDQKADALEGAIGAGGQAVADLTYGQKLIAEAIVNHFGERDERYDEYEGDTTVQDVWEAFDALSQPHPASVLPEGTIAVHGKDVVIAYDSLKDARRAFSMLEAAMSPQPTEGEPSDAEVERVAQFLHDEVEWPEYDYSDRTWPEHEGDTGQRGDGWLKIVPSDTCEQFRDIARRLAPLLAAKNKGGQANG